MKSHKVTISENPDEYSSGHSVKRVLTLLIVSIAICWVAMEIVKLAAITIPIPILVVIHAPSFVVILYFYRWLQLRAQQRC